MKTLYRKSRPMLLPWVLTVGLMLGAAASAQASLIVFNFSDEYYVGSLSTYHNVFGASASGFDNPGIYQLVDPATSAVAKLSANFIVPGEYAQDGTPAPDQLLALTGWSQSLKDGQPIANVYNLTNPITGTVLYFRYLVSGMAQPFDLVGLDVAAAPDGQGVSFTMAGMLSGSAVHSTVVTAAAGTFQTALLNWSDIDAVGIVSTAALPLNWSAQTLWIDNIVLDTAATNGDPPSTANPEPGTMLLMGLGSLGVLIARKRRRTSA